MNIQAYLKRINYSGSIDPTLETLTQLQKAHLLAIPFENLDIHTNKEIILDIHSIFSKIVDQNRGGFCYELNGLFHALLLQLNFKVKRISARVFSKEKGYGPEFDHLANLVTIDGKEYLTDVGFGDFTLSPLKFELHTKQKDESGIFYIDKYDDYYRVNKEIDNEITAQYIFKDLPREFNDFLEMCHFQQYDPNSHFRTKKMITLPTDDGRITLNNENLKITKGKQIENIQIKTKRDFDSALWKYFKMKI
jgi:N-hydroxyarylamine O-acetyltransferase